MTATEFANAHEDVCVFFAGVGCSAGTTIALLEDTKLSFDLDEIEGDVDASGTFEATNLKDGTGLRGWRFHDWNCNLIYKIQLFEDAQQWQEQQEELESCG